jgi:hypothetical protein
MKMPRIDDDQFAVHRTRLGGEGGGEEAEESELRSDWQAEACPTKAARPHLALETPARRNTRGAFQLMATSLDA